MKLICPYCNEEFNDIINKEGDTYKAVCFNCEKTFEPDLPKGKVIMTFADDSDPNRDYENFKDDFTPKRLQTYHAFDSMYDFIDYWQNMLYDNTIEGMWYYVLVDNELILCGACDPDDIESFKEYIPTDLEMNLKLRMDRPIEKDHIITPGSFEFMFDNNKLIRFDFTDSEKEIDENDPCVVSFKLRNIDMSYEDDFNKYPNKITKMPCYFITDYIMNHNVTAINEIFAYTGENGDPEINVAAVLDISFEYDNVLTEIENDVITTYNARNL